MQLFGLKVGEMGIDEMGVGEQVPIQPNPNKT